MSFSQKCTTVTVFLLAVSHVATVLINDDLVKHINKTNSQFYDAHEAHADNIEELRAAVHLLRLRVRALEGELKKADPACCPMPERVAKK